MPFRERNHRGVNRDAIIPVLALAVAFFIAGMVAVAQRNQIEEQEDVSRRAAENEASMARFCKTYYEWERTQSSPVAGMQKYCGKYKQ